MTRIVSSNASAGLCSALLIALLCLSGPACDRTTSPTTRSEPAAASEPMVEVGEEVAEEAAEEPAAEASSLSEKITAMGYEIVTGPGMGELSVLRGGEKVWGVNTYMITHHSFREGSGEAVELVVETRETRREGTDYVIELGPEGARVVSETAGEPSGIQPPGRSTETLE